MSSNLSLKSVNTEIVESVLPQKNYNVNSAQESLETILGYWDKDGYDTEINIQRQEQRNNKNEKQEFRQGIMESIINGFRIPAIIVNKKKNNRGDRIVYIRRVVDGAHRLRAIISFLKSEYEIIINEVKYKFKTLPLDDQCKLLAKCIDVITYVDLDEKAESDIFIKYNNVKPLHPGNRIKAENNEIVNHITSIIEENKETIKTLPTRLHNPVRDTFISILTSIYSFEFLGKNAETGKSSKWVKNPTEGEVRKYIQSKDKFQNAIEEALDLFTNNEKFKYPLIFKLLVIMLYRYNEENIEMYKIQLQKALIVCSQQEDFGNARNNGSKKDMINAIGQIEVQLSKNRD